MKVYTIGREESCDIVIHDNTDVISRRHAAINVYPSGKMTIVDYSHNGTYVNGIRITENVPVPVTRKDNISFARVARLDWNRIPNTRAAILRYTLIGLLAVILIGGGLWAYLSWDSGSKAPEPLPEPEPMVAAVDSTDIQTEEEKAAEREKQLQDSIKKQVEDSLKKVQEEAAKKAARPAATRKEPARKAEPKEVEPTQEKPQQQQEESKKRFR